MKLVSSDRTMAGAKWLIRENTGPTPRRDKLIEASRRWQEDQASRAKLIKDEVDRLERKALLEQAMRQRSTPAITIIEMVAAWHGFQVHDILSTNKPTALVEARFDAIAAVRLNCRIMGRQMSLPEIGRVFGGRDHTTILHALRMRGL
jgi:chromosomal replication initiation ATPase DnaA